MLLSRAKAAGKDKHAFQKKEKIPKLEVFINGRDYTGAIKILEAAKATDVKHPDQKSANKELLKNSMWLAYCHFHLGNYQDALDEYTKIIKVDQCPLAVHIYIACCMFFLGQYNEAKEKCEKEGMPAIKDSHGETSKLCNRLMFHLSHKFNDEKELMSYHKNLQDVVEDQLSLASIHYLRSHYQEAIDIYKRILLDNRDYLALNVYVALCYYKLDYYDVSQEVLGVYLQHHPDSTVAVNLKACNHYKLYNGKAAEAELKGLSEMCSDSFKFASDLIKHNLVVFRAGEGALQVLPPLVDVIPEARLNLVIYHLRNDDIQEAYKVFKDVSPSTPQEYILKGVVNATIGQEQGLTDHIKIAQQYFQSYFYNDDAFNFNFGQAKAATGNFKEAEEAFLMVRNERLKVDYVYLGWLAKCYIMNKKPRLAWELYLKQENSVDSFSLLQLIANDCYKMGQFYYSCKAFDVLERLDSNPEYWEGKRGAGIGLFQQIIAGHEPRETLRELVALLRNTGNSQVEFILGIIKNWAKENRVSVT